MNSSAIIFPGQGCQAPGMAAEFFRTYEESRQVFDQASAATELDLQKICFTESELLNRTEFTQPAILTAEIAIWAALKKHFALEPVCYAGHSLGEYTALVAAEVIELKDAVKIVRERGALMQAATPCGFGAMAALIVENIVDLNIEQVLKQSGAELANINSKNQLVISGEANAVRLASEQLASEHPEIRVVPLNVSAPFHSSHMRKIEAKFEEVLRSFEKNFVLENAPKVLSNYSGIAHSGEGLVPMLVHQVSAPVRWMDNMKALSLAATTLYEVGPQRVLSKFLDSIGRQAKAITDLRSLQRAFGGTSSKSEVSHVI